MGNFSSTKMIAAQRCRDNAIAAKNTMVSEKSNTSKIRMMI